MLNVNEMVKKIDELIIKEWKEYNPSDLNDIILGLIQNHEPYTNMQPYYLDYLIEDLQELRKEL